MRKQGSTVSLKVCVQHFMMLCIVFFGSHQLVAQAETKVETEEAVQIEQSQRQDSVTGKIEYKFPENAPIDVVIPCTEKDLPTLELCISGIRANCQNIGRIFIISKTKLSENAEWIKESDFPFTKENVAFELFRSEDEAKSYIENPKNRLGWMYQQLLKLYVSFVIEGISSNVLILDADTIFLNPVTFLQENGAAYFNFGWEHHLPYFAHMQKLLPYLKRVFPEYSGICHHMLFQKVVLEDLKLEIETAHQEPMWKALIHCIDQKEIYDSALSEYEIYFNFAFQRSDQFKIRQLDWMNVATLEYFGKFKENENHYVSAHSWMR